MAKKKQNSVKRSILGETLTRLRKSYGLTQEQVADILKIKRSTYAYYEQETTPTPEIIYQLKTLFSVPLHVLMYGVPEEPVVPSGMLNDQSSIFGGPDPKMIMGFSSLKDEEQLLIANFRVLPENLRNKYFLEIITAAQKAE